MQPTQLGRRLVRRLLTVPGQPRTLLVVHQTDLVRPGQVLVESCRWSNSVGRPGSSTVFARSSARLPPTISSGRGRSRSVSIKIHFTGLDQPLGAWHRVTIVKHFAGNRTAFAVALVCVAQFVIVLDVTVVTSALPALGRELGLPRRRPAVGSDRLRAGLRRVPGRRRPGRGPVRRPARLHDRTGRVRRRVAGLRPGPGRLGADRRPGAAGAGRRPAHAGRARVAQRGDRAGRRPAEGRRDLDRGGRRRRGVRVGAGRAAHRVRRVALGLPDQRADRRGGVVGGRARPAAGAAGDGTAAGPARGDRTDRRPQLGRLRAERGRGGLPRPVRSSGSPCCSVPRSWPAPSRTSVESLRPYCHAACSGRPPYAGRTCWPRRSPRAPARRCSWPCSTCRRCWR